MTGKLKTGHVNVRFDEQTKKALEKEALTVGLDLGAYIRYLVFTHQDRNKKKGEK